MRMGVLNISSFVSEKVYVAYWFSDVLFHTYLRMLRLFRSVDWNQIAGAIPTEFGQLAQLSIISLCKYCKMERECLLFLFLVFVHFTSEPGLF